MQPTIQVTIEVILYISLREAQISGNTHPSNKPIEVKYLGFLLFIWYLET